jgi:hypothetical protein
MLINLTSRSGIATRLILSASLVLLCGSAFAQDPTSATFAGPRIDPATTHEITVAGTIQQVIPSNTPDLRISLLTPQGIFTTSFGPSLRKDVKNSLTTGQQIQITGTIQTVNGQATLFARLLTYSDHLVIVRNEHGFPVHTTAGTLAAAQALQNGDAK